MAPAPPLSRDDLVWALSELGRRALAEQKTIEIAVYGGSALVLLFDWRIATRDVDAVFEADKATVRRLARQIADEHGWDGDWLNDGVKGFLSVADAEPGVKRLFGTYPSEAEPGLRVMVANPHYLFAMKCRAMRLGAPGANADIDDIRRLGQEIGIADAQAAIDLVMQFYPAQRLEPKVRFGIEEIFGGSETSL